MSRRGRWLLAALAAVVLLAALLSALAWRQMQPERLTPLLLREASQALGLEIRVREPAEYGLRPEPRLLLRGLSAHRPGEPAPLLTAERAELSLPWATLRGRGLDITRVDLQQPRLDLPELLAWLDARTPGEGPTRLPTLTRGLALVDASLVARDWRIEALDIDLPHFQPGRATQLDASGQLHAAGRVLPFSVDLVASAELTDSGLALALTALALQARDGEAADAVAYRLDTAGEAGFGGGRVWLDAPGSLLWIEPASPDTHVEIDLHPMRISHVSGTTTLERSAFAVTGGEAIPSLHGHLEARLAQSLQLRADARMERWPGTWPALPEPLASAGGPYLAELAYRGPLDFGAPMDLNVTHEQALLESRFVLHELLAWSLPGTGYPLPPLTGRLQATALTLGNTRLEGVSVVMHGEAGNHDADDADDPDAAGSDEQ